MRTVTSFILWLAALSPVWASGEEPDAKFQPVGMWRFVADHYTAIIEFSGRGTCLVTYQSAGVAEYRGCGWEASGRTVNLYPFESELWEPVALIALSDAEIQFVSNRRVVFHRLTSRDH